MIKYLILKSGIEIIAEIINSKSQSSGTSRLIKIKSPVKLITINSGEGKALSIMPFHPAINMGRPGVIKESEIVSQFDVTPEFEEAYKKHLEPKSDLILPPNLKRK
jgi:hypothetical protein